jgi:lysophospholipase L1-like esterase
MSRSQIFGVAILVFVAVGFFFFRASNPDIKNYPSKGGEIVAFGDSLVEGVGATEGNDLFSILARKLGTRILNYGRTGDTTALALARLPQVFKDVPHPKMAIIVLGGNDFLQKVPSAVTFSNISKIIEEFQSRGAVVVILGVRGGILRDNFEVEYEALRDKYKTGYVSDIVGDLALFKREYMYDSIHPNDQGYALIAERVHPIINELIKE